MTRRIVPVVLAALCAVGCEKTGIICTSSEKRCGNTCANFQSDPDHCGGCGITCGTDFVCQSGQCVCPSGIAGITACGQSCVNLRNSSNNCGTCGNVCPTGSVCVDGACTQACPPDTVLCGGDCVNVTRDRAHCGGCIDDGGVACPQGQACIDGVCGSDLYAACYNSGEIYALDAEAEVVSPVKQLAPPSNPSGLAFHGSDELDAVDGIANTLYSFDVSGGGFGTPTTVATGLQPNAISISGDVAAVVNTGDNSLDLFDFQDGGWVRRCPADAGGCAATVQFSPDSSPLYAAFDTEAVYVSLQGNTQAAGATGNALAKVSLADLSTQLVDLGPDAGLDLQSDGGTQARPNGVAVGNGQVYVALANLNGYTASGPGLVAVLDVVPDGGAPVMHGQPVALGEGCVNAGAVLLAGAKLYVACGPEYDPSTFAVVQPGALAGLDTGTLQPLFAPQVLACPGDAGDCAPGAAGRLAIAGGKLYIGDASDGRLFVADPTTGLLERGPANALAICPAQSGSFANISDVVARP